MYGSVYNIHTQVSLLHEIGITRIISAYGRRIRFYGDHIVNIHIASRHISQDYI